MELKYKLTDQNMQTYNNYQWKLDEWREIVGDIKQSLCTNAWFHCYDSPLLAVLHKPLHTDIDNPRLFEVEVDGETKNDRGLKRGCRKMRLIREIPLPEITNIQKIAYGILCAKEVYKNEDWNKWADDWLSNKDRTARAADIIYKVTYAPYAAESAAAYAAYASFAEADPLYVAFAAADAAAYMTHLGERINLVKIAEEAMKY